MKLVSGTCALIECEVVESLGAGVLVTANKNDRDQGPLLCMARSTVHNCDFGGIEAREGGNLIVQDCEVYDNGLGVLIWNPLPKDKMKVKLHGCAIFNNDREGVLASGLIANTLNDYANNVSVQLEGCKIHHNQIGASLAFFKEYSVKNNTIFSNGSWGIFLR